MTAAEIEALGGYYGATPRPDDFESFWQARMAEADAVPLHYTVTQAQEVPSWDSCEFLDLWFTGMEGARLYAKFLRPRRSEPMPLVLQFHGYPGASRSFAEQASFAGMGMALIAMDCPGQAGYSEDVGISLPGWTARRSGCTMCGCTRTSASSAAGAGAGRHRHEPCLCQRRFAGRRAGSGLCGAEPGAY